MSRFISLSSTSSTLVIAFTISVPDCHSGGGDRADADAARTASSIAPTMSSSGRGALVQSPSAPGPAGAARSSARQSLAVMTITGMSRHRASLLERSRNSKPSISGIIRSSRIDGRRRVAARASRAPRGRCVASAAVSPIFATVWRSISRAAGSSSTTSTGAVPAHQAAQQRREPRAVDRLGHELGGAEREAQPRSDSIVTMTTGMSHELAVGLERAQHRPAVHPRHHDVERDRRRAAPRAPARAPRRRRGRGRRGSPALADARSSSSCAAGSSSTTSTVVALPMSPRDTRRPATACLRGLGLVRQDDREGRALAGLACDRDVAAQHLAEVPGDRQPEPGAAVLACWSSCRPG